MRILIAHNFYRIPGGEDEVFRNESALLEDNGHEVIRYTRSNDELDEYGLANRLRMAANAIWSRDTYRDLSQLLKRERPDIVHFHNTHPMISPSGYTAARDAGIPVIQTLHNYRLVCPGALLQRNGKPCETCVGRSPIPGVVHRCYQNSTAASAVVAGTLIWNRMRKRYTDEVSRYIALTEFSASRFINGGIPESQISIKPNFLPHPPAPGEGEGGYALFVGRLSPEKGLHTLLSAWNDIPHIPLHIVGGGPLEAMVRAAADARPGQIYFHGPLPHDQVLSLLRGASCLVTPSEWYEGFPMVILEAYACGTPVLASDIGSLSEVVIEGNTGLKFPPAEPQALASTVMRAFQEPERLQGMRRLARQRYDENYSPEVNYRQLLVIYRDVLQDSAATIKRTRPTER